MNALQVKKTKHILAMGKKSHTMHFHISVHILIFFFTSMWLEVETTTANHKFPEEIILAGKFDLQKLFAEAVLILRGNKLVVLP